MTARTGVARAVVLVAALAAGGSGVAGAAQLRTAYHTSIHTESWEPIRIADMKAVVSQHVAEGLASKGRMVLVKAPARGAPQNADLSLIIEGDLVGEAGSFVLTLTLRPLKDPSLPSFAASATVSLGRLKRMPTAKRKPAIYKALVRAAREASSRLHRAFDAHAAATGETGRSGSPEVKELFDWTRLQPPRERGKGRDFAIFARTSADRTKRMRAGERLSAHAYDDPAVRHLLERTVLSDPDPIIRYYAVRYLGPSARRYRFTKRVLLAALREDSDPKVRQVAFSISPSFVAELPAETVQTWVELLRSKPAEFTGMRKLEKLLRARLDAPNLDSALLECLQHKAILVSTSSARKSHCRALANRLPHGRRLRLLLAYVSGKGAPVDKHEKHAAAKSLESAVAKPPRYMEALATQRLAADAYRRLRDVQFREALADGLIEGYPFPAAVKVVVDAIQKTEDQFLFKAGVRWLAHMGKTRYNRCPPWGVDSWDLAQETLRELSKDRGWASRVGLRSSRSTESQIKDALADFRAQRQLAHRVAVREHLGADGRPTEAALDYFVECVLGSSDPVTQTDCAGGVHWIAVHYAPLRRKAVGAAAGLLHQQRTSLADNARDVLERVERSVSSLYRGYSARYGRKWYSCPWSER